LPILSVRSLPAALVALCLILTAQVAAAVTMITVDPSVRYQTFRAWEATANLNWPKELDPWFDPILDGAVAEVGITRIRVGVFCGDENRTRGFQRLMSGEITYDEYRLIRYATVNDDDDPFHIDPAGFDFADLDWRIERQVIPVKTRVEARGEAFSFTLNYVAFTDQTGKGGQYHHTDPDEYAEFILAAFMHLRDRWKLVPDALEVILEPDLVKEWTPELMGRAMAAVTARLRNAGFTPRLIAPSVTDARQFGPWMDGISAVPGATDALWELAYHRYRGGQADTLREIGARGAERGLPTGMLEFVSGKGTYPVLHSDLTLANVSSWQGRALMGFYRVDPTAGDPPILMHDDVRMIRQYSHFIRPGMTRVGALSDTPGTFDPLVFTAEDGRATLVIKADVGGEFTVAGLPPGDYYISHATAAGTLDRLDPVRLAPGGTLTAAIPDAGVLTVSTIAP
jgi:hypothetical protein